MHAKELRLVSSSEEQFHSAPDIPYDNRVTQDTVTRGTRLYPPNRLPRRRKLKLTVSASDANIKGSTIPEGDPPPDERFEVSYEDKTFRLASALMNHAGYKECSNYAEVLSDDCFSEELLSDSDILSSVNFDEPYSLAQTRAPTTATSSIQYPSSNSFPETTHLASNLSEETQSIMQYAGTKLEALLVQHSLWHLMGLSSQTQKEVLQCLRSRSSSSTSSSQLLDPASATAGTTHLSEEPDPSVRPVLEGSALPPKQRTTQPVCQNSSHQESRPPGPAIALSKHQNFKVICPHPPPPPPPPLPPPPVDSLKKKMTLPQESRYLLQPSQPAPLKQVRLNVQSQPFTESSSTRMSLMGPRRQLLQGRGEKFGGFHSLKPLRTQRESLSEHATLTAHCKKKFQFQTTAKCTPKIPLEPLPSHRSVSSGSLLGVKPSRLLLLHEKSDFGGLQSSNHSEKRTAAVPLLRIPHASTPSAKPSMPSGLLSTPSAKKKKKSTDCAHSATHHRFESYRSVGAGSDGPNQSLLLRFPNFSSSSSSSSQRGLSEKPHADGQSQRHFGRETEVTQSIRNNGLYTARLPSRGPKYRSSNWAASPAVSPRQCETARTVHSPKPPSFSAFKSFIKARYYSNNFFTKLFTLATKNN